MKTFAICFVALFAVAAARSVFDDFDDNESNFDDKMTGGEDTTIERHPHHISVRSTVFHICGGTIISPTRGLTAAHRLTRNDTSSGYLIRAGTSSHHGSANSQTRTLYRFLRHERFNSPFFANNIAILYWKEPLTFGANVRAIRLPAANAPVPYGQNATLTGWATDTGPVMNLRVISNPLISNEDCKRELPQLVQPSTLCTGGVVGRGGCFHDEGGPLVHNNNLIGILSWVKGRCATGAPDVYTRVASFIDWINENSK